MQKKYIEIINREYLFYLDRGQGWQQLHSRDRALALAVQKERGVGDQQVHQDELLKQWQKRRLQESEGPGESIYQLCQHLYSLAFLLAFFLGFSTLFGFLLYTGQEAINIVSLLTVSVLFPWCCTLFFLLLFFRSDSPLLFPIFQKSLFFLLKRRRGEKGKRDLEILAFLGSIKKKREFWLLLRSSLLLLQQQLATLFCLGMILAFLYKIVVTNIAFGWQTTLQLADQFVLNLVKIIAFPWSWSDIPTPTLDQISGSKIVVKDGIYALAQTDLSSWWPFLFLCLLCYALLPRLILLLFFVWRQERAFQRYCQLSRESDQLVLRMRTPLVDLSDQRAGEEKNSKQFLESPTPVSSSRERTLLVPYDLYPFDIKRAISWLGQYGFTLSAQHYFQKSYRQDLELLENAKSSNGYIVVLEAAMPPLKETTLFLEQLQKSSGKELDIALLGGDRRKLDAAIGKDLFLLWQQHIQALAREKINIIRPNLE